MLARVRWIALGFPASAEKILHGRPAFYTTKIFAYYGGSVKIDGVWAEHEQSLLVLPDQSGLGTGARADRLLLPNHSHGATRCGTRLQLPEGPAAARLRIAKVGHTSVARWGSVQRFDARSGLRLGAGRSR